MSNEKTINFTFNFNAPVGQNIAHVDKLEAHFDKDMTMQVVDTKSMSGNSKEENKTSSLLSCIETLMDEKDSSGKYLVSQCNHWIAIFRIIVDKELGVSNTDYLGFCHMINGMKTGGFRVPLKQENLKKISNGMFTNPFNKWKYDPAYNPTRKPYVHMVAVATRFKEILEENGF